MVIVYPGKPYQFSMDGGLYDQLQRMRIAIRDNWDFLILICGPERAGKSTLAMQILKVLDENFCINNIAFNTQELEYLFKNMPSGSGILYDESYADTSSGAVMSALSKKVGDIMRRIGWKNYFMVFVGVDYFDFNKYIATKRASMMIKVDVTPDFKRGHFKGWTAGKLKRLYREGRKQYDDYNVVNRDFFGTFPNAFFLDQAAYDQRKQKAFNKINLLSADDEIKELAYNIMFERSMEMVSEGLISDIQARYLLKMPESTYFNKKKKYKTIENDALKGDVYGFTPPTDLIKQNNSIKD